MRVIVVSGTPGSGKTTFAKRLAKEKGFVYVDVTALIKREKLYTRYDRSLKSYVVDMKKLIKFLESFIRSSERSMVIDSHLGHELSPKLVSECIIVKTSIPKLRSRLKKRGYAQRKIEENVAAELFDVCYNEAVEKGHKVRVVNS